MGIESLKHKRRRKRVQKERIEALNHKEIKKGDYVLCWM